MRRKARGFPFVLEEGGITLIEVTIALFLVFMALTALVALVGAAGRLNAYSRASQQASLIANQKLEDIRNMAFDDIGFPEPQSGEPLGTLPRVETTSVGGVEYRIGLGIWWVDATETAETTQDYKRVTVTVSWDRLVNGTTQTASYRVTSLVSQASRRTPGAIINPPPPVLNVLAGSPPEESVVAGTVFIRIDTDPTSTGYLYSGLEVRIGGGLAGEKVNVNPPASTASQTYYWDTTLVEDGRYEIEAYAYEARGGSAYRTWYYYVNNSPPAEAPSLAVSSVGVDGATLRWNLVTDGNETVYRYALRRDFPLPSAVQTVLVGSNGGDAEYVLSGLAPWTTYRYAVAAVSHGDTGPYSSPEEFRTKIALSVTETGYKNKGKWYYNATLSWTPCPYPAEISRIEVVRQILNPDGSVKSTNVWQVSPTTSSYSDNGGYAEGTRVQYLIQAVRADGNIDNVSPLVTVRMDGVNGS